MSDEKTVPTIGTVWVEHETMYAVEYWDGSIWDCGYDDVFTATGAVSIVKETLEGDIEPEHIRIVETLKIRRVMLGGELEARAKRESGEL